MKLTPLDIKRHSFEKGFRGYDPAEVDGYLKQVADQFESLQEELRLAHERTRDTESKLQHYERVEMALQEALESAKASAQRSEEDAARRAAVIIEEAELRAQQVLQDVERERFGMKQDLVRLSSRQAEVAARLRGFLMSELEVLTDFQGGAPAGLLRMDESEPMQITQEASAPISDVPSDIDVDADSTDGTGEIEDALDVTAGDVSELASLPDALPEVSSHAPIAPPLAASSGVSEAAPYAPPAAAPSAPEAPLVDIGSRAHEDDLPPIDSEILGPPTPVVSDDVPISTGGWSAPSDANVAGSEAERERIRRILEDLD